MEELVIDASSPPGLRVYPHAHEDAMHTAIISTKPATHRIAHEPVILAPEREIHAHGC